MNDLLQKLLKNKIFSIEVEGKDNDIEGLNSNVQSSNGWPHLPILKPNEDMTNRISTR